MTVGRLACRTIAALLLAASAAVAQPGKGPEGPAPQPRLCPIVDRGFILDGVTTITVLSPGAPCNAGALWNGWWCMSVRSDANVAEGPPYEIHVRWNLPGAVPNATFTWMIGGGSVGWFRDSTTTKEGARIQDVLAAEGVRTIECSFVGNGTYEPPANGYPSISAAYADLLEYLTAEGLMEGVRGHFGNSGGSLMAANALAYHRVEKLLDGVVFGSGAFWSDLEPVCTDPGSPLYGDTTIRDRADQLGWNVEGTTPCISGAPVAEPSYACRSLLGPDADTDYPDLMMSVMVGTLDTEFAWFDPSVTQYFQGVTAFSKTFDHPQSVHNMMNSPAGADTVLARIRDIVAGTRARRGMDEAPAPDRKRGPELRAAVPNPFHDGTLLSFRLPQAGDVLLTVHDVAGRRVARLLDARREAGEHAVRWNAADDAGRPVAAGIYFARLRTAAGQSVVRLQVVR